MLVNGHAKRRAGHYGCKPQRGKGAERDLRRDFGLLQPQPPGKPVLAAISDGGTILTSHICASIRR